jgi:hypothetical protein
VNYLFLAYDVEQRLAAMPAGERETYAAACLASAELLRQGGRLLAAQRLVGGPVRVWNDQVTIPESTVGGASEQLVGLFFIQARDLNDAIRVALQMTQAAGGPIDVLPMTDLDLQEEP